MHASSSPPPLPPPWSPLPGPSAFVTVVSDYLIQSLQSAHTQSQVLVGSYDGLNLEVNASVGGAVFVNGRNLTKVMNEQGPFAHFPSIWVERRAWVTSG